MFLHIVRKHARRRVQKFATWNTEVASTREIVTEFAAMWSHENGPTEGVVAVSPTFSKDLQTFQKLDRNGPLSEFVSRGEPADGADVASFIDQRDGA